MQQIPVGPGSDDGGAGGQRAAIHEVLDDLAYQRVGLANVVYWGVPGSNRWVLIDAGARGTASLIVAMSRCGARRIVRSSRATPSSRRRTSRRIRLRIRRLRCMVRPCGIHRIG